MSQKFFETINKTVTLPKLQVRILKQSDKGTKTDTTYFITRQYNI